MESDELKMRVAQNCNRYKTKCSMELINSISYHSESCRICINYIKEKCAEGLFDKVREIININ